MKTLTSQLREAINKVPQQTQPGSTFPPQYVTLSYYGDINDMRTYRRCDTIDNAERICTLQSHIVIECANGDARQVKVNGKVRRWKRNAGRIEIPLKYGLYEYLVFVAEDVERILIPV